MADAERFRKRQLAAEKKKFERGETAPLRAMQPKSRELRFDNPRSASAEKGVINLLYRFPEQFGALPLEGSQFSSKPLGRLYDALMERARKGQSISISVLGERFSQDEMQLLTEIISHDETTPSAAEAAMSDYIRKIQEEHDKASQADDLRDYARRMKQRKGYDGKDDS